MLNLWSIMVILWSIIGRNLEHYFKSIIGTSLVKTEAVFVLLWSQYRSVFVDNFAVIHFSMYI